MENINYDSFYKFLASLGLILIAIPFTVVLFLFTDSFNLQISEIDLVGYTQTAQDVIRLKQSMPLLIEKWYVWLIFVIFFIVGIELICIGLKNWYKMQKVEDKHKQQELEKLEQEIRENTADMSDEQIMQKKIVDTSDEQITQNNISSENSGSMAMKSFLIEQKFSDLVKSTDHSRLIKCNIRIGDCDYDMVAFSNQLFEKDYVYEIKYMREGITPDRIKQYRDKMKKLKQTFSEKLNRIPYMVLVIVVADNVYEHTQSIVNGIEKWNNYLIEVKKESEL